MKLVSLLSQGACCAFTLLLMGAPGGTADPPKEPPAKIDLELIPDPDVEWLKRSKVATDDAGLLAFLRSCQGKEVSPADIDSAIAKLMTGSKAEQDDVAKKLAEYGTITVPLLRKHRTTADADAAKRVRDSLEKIEEAGDKPLARPAMRRLLIRRPAGTAEAMLGYLPFASDPAAEEDIYYGLDALVEKDVKTLAILATALKDAQPSRRALSACILGRRGNAEQRQAVRDLLKDADALVRLRAAQGLLAGKDAGGVSTLIDLLTDPSIEIAWQAEELLRWVSNETAPDVVVGGAAASGGRSEARQAWLQWAKDHAAKINFAELEKEPRRPLLVFVYTQLKGELWLMGSDGVTRFDWHAREQLADAQYVPGGTVLALYKQPVREKPLLTEWDRRGAKLWTHDNMADPRRCQQLSNGHVFVAEYMDNAEPFLRYQIVASGGRIVSTQPRQSSAPPRASALLRRPDGKILCADFYPLGANRFRQMHEYDPHTNTAKTFFAAGDDLGCENAVEAIENGVLLAGFEGGGSPISEIIDYDTDGDRFWKYKLGRVSHAIRMRSGNTLVSGAGRMIEISADRRLVGEMRTPRNSWVARPCLTLIRFGFDTYSKDMDLETDFDYRVRSLRKKDPKARVFALEHLAEFKWWAASAIPKLKAHGEDPDPAVREAMRKTLTELGAEKIPELLKEAKDPDPERRYLAVGRLGGHVNGPGVLDALLEALKDENAKVRWMAVRSLGSAEKSSQSRPFVYLTDGAYRWAAEKVVPELLKAAKDADKQVRQDAFRVLGLMGPEGKLAIPTLIDWLMNEADSTTRYHSAIVLGKVGHGSGEARDALLSVAKEKNSFEVRHWAVEGLCHLRPVPSSVANLLIELYLFADDSTEMGGAKVRGTYLHKLREIKANDKATIEFVSRIMKDESVPLIRRQSAAEHLIETGPEPVAVIKYMFDLAAKVPDRSTRASIEQSIRWHKKNLNRRINEGR